MRWSFKIGVIFGIDIRVHAVFLLLLAFIGWSNTALGGMASGFAAMLWFLTIFFFVLLHELGHSLVAIKYGVRVIDIVLLPIGGVARMERLPKNPLQEIAIALAGPAVNLVAVLIVLLVMYVTGKEIERPSFNFAGKDFWNGLFTLNLFMGSFNLIPAFPMDGGRVLRGLLAMRLTYGRATHYAANLGRTLAVMFGVAGLLIDFNWWWVLIALFIFSGAGSEDRLVNFRDVLSDLTVERVMSSVVCSLNANDPLRNALDYAAKGLRADLPVVENNGLVGLLPLSRVQAAMRLVGPEAPVRNFMLRRFMAVRPSASLLRVYEEMSAKRLEAVPVIEREQVVGILTMEDIGRFVQTEALERA